MDIPRAPAWLSAEQRQIWEELLAGAPPGLWQSVDSWGIEAIAVLVARCRSAEATTGDFRQLFSALDRYGLTPRSRARITAANARIEKKRSPN